MKANGIMAVLWLASAQAVVAENVDDHANHHETTHARDHSAHSSGRDAGHPHEHTGQEANHKSHGKRFNPSPERVIERLDDNGDGLVSLDEFEMPKRESGRHRWEALDSNDDGELTRAEVQGHVNEQWQRFESMDSNNDDRVTRAEAQAALFSRLDSNKDGYLDASELKQMQDERRERHQRH